MALAARTLVLALLLGSAVAAGCGEPGRELPAEWKGRDVEAAGWQDGDLRAGWTLGIEYVWSSGTVVRWDWLTNGTAPLHFQVVRMEEGRAQPLVGQIRDESAGQVTTPVAGAHHILLGNEGFTPVQFWYNLPEGGITRVYPPGESPDCPPARLLAAVC